jgi:hypothetical protein
LVSKRWSPGKDWAVHIGADYIALNSPIGFAIAIPKTL